MKSKRFLKTAFLSLFCGLFIPMVLGAQGIKRNIPLDLCLIIDGSEFFLEGKNEALNWVNRELVDGILQEGDSLTVWQAGGEVKIAYSAAIGSKKDEIKDVLSKLENRGREADFSSALREAVSLGGKDRNRLDVIMLVLGSAKTLAPSMNSTPDLFRWSRVDEYSGWQVLVAAPDIGAEARRLALEYMSRH